MTSPCKKTVGIPAYNEEKSIKRCLNSIMPQLGVDDEVIIVASGCTDNTVKKAASLKDGRIRIIIQKEKRGKVAAINKILENAKNSIIILSDADVIPAKNSINILSENLLQKNVGAVSAKIVNYKRENFFDKLQGFGWEALNDQKIEENNKNTFYALNGFLAGVKKEAVPRLDETSLVDDAILGYEVKKQGFKVLYLPDALVYVKAAQNLKDYIKQKTRVRVGWWQMTKKGMEINERRNLKQLKYLFSNFYAWPYIGIDFIIWVKAYLDFKNNKLTWDQIITSKI